MIGMSDLDKEGNYEVRTVEKVITYRETSNNNDCNCKVGIDYRCKYGNCNVIREGLLQKEHIYDGEKY